MMNGNEYSRYDTDALNKIPFETVIARLGGTVSRKGRTRVTKCPWHDDHHPSLVIYEDSNRCVCYACNERKARTVIDYVMQVKGYGFKDACEWLGGSRSPLTHGGSPPASKGSPPAPEGGVRRQCAKRKKKSIKELLAMDDLNTQRKMSNRMANSPFGGWGASFGGGGLDMDFLSQFVSSDNSFCNCLKHIFPENIVEVFTQLYMLGRYSDLGNADDVLFPSIDKHFRLADIKVQHYDSNPQSPNFFHCDKKHIYWLSSILKRKARRGALFGEHLLTSNPDMPVALVESPKNAVVGACAFHDLVWVAAGNKGNISRESLQCLQGRNVLVLPDHDAIEEWKSKLEKMQDIASFTFSPFNDNQLLECGEKGDIADWIIKKLSQT